MTMKFMLCICLALAIFFMAVGSSEELREEPTVAVEEFTETESTAEVDPAKIEYAQGSVCTYCSYCEFCKLCEDCPCETSKTKPNCKMCKYCKFCYLCDAFCNTVCTAGGILDRVSGAIVNSLPSFNKEEVEDDIDSVKDWIKKKDEL